MPSTLVNFKLLHIFTNHGKTFTFRDGSITADNESQLSFDYSAASDGEAKHATFQKANIAGWSICNPLAGLP